MSDNKIDLCGCGKPVRYEDLETQEGSCNKYKRCPSYEELLIEVNKLRKCKSTLEKIKVVNAMDLNIELGLVTHLKIYIFTCNIQ